MAAQLYMALTLSEKFSIRFLGVTGPSMEPTLDFKNNLVMLDCFTAKILRNP